MVYASIQRNTKKTEEYIIPLNKIKDTLLNNNKRKL